jgi:hypothetical protein
VVVDVGHLVMLAAFGLLVPILVGMCQEAMVVLMAVVVRAVLKHPQELAALMMMRNVIMVMGMRHRGMRMLMLDIADNPLRHISLLHVDHPFFVEC